MTTCIREDTDACDSTAARANQRYHEQLHSLYSRLDQLFAVLLLLEWSAAVSFALVITPYTWAGEDALGALARLGGDRSGRRDRRLPVASRSCVRPRR